MFLIFLVVVNLKCNVPTRVWIRWRCYVRIIFWKMMRSAVLRWKMSNQAALWPMGISCTNISVSQSDREKFVKNSGWKKCSRPGGSGETGKASASPLLSKWDFSQKISSEFYPFWAFSLSNFTVFLWVCLLLLMRIYQFRRWTSWTFLNNSSTQILVDLLFSIEVNSRL